MLYKLHREIIPHILANEGGSTKAVQAQWPMETTAFCNNHGKSTMARILYGVKVTQEEVKGWGQGMLADV